MVRIVKLLTMSRSMAASESARLRSGYPMGWLDLATVGGSTVPRIDNPLESAMIAFEVNDMTCGHCVSTITKALKATDRNAKVQIELATHRVQVEPVSADAEELAEAIKDAGYTPVPVAVAASQVAAPSAGSCCGHCR
jgi:copper chaperone